MSYNGNAQEVQKKKRALLTRKGVILIALLAFMVLMVNMITATYSWFQPTSESNTSLSYVYTGQLRSENCTLSTYKGTKQSTAGNGLYINQIVYDASATSGSVSVAAGATQYFKTNIVNNDKDYPSDVSLYLATIPACTVAVTYPSNSVRTLSSGTDDYYLIRNAYVKQYVDTDVNGPGLLEVEWFIKNTGSSAVSIDLSKLYLMYN